MKVPRSHRRSETANPILFITQRLPQSARVSAWQLLDASILAPIGFVLATYALNDLMARGFLSRSMIWSVLVLMCAPLISILIQLLMRFQSTAMDRIARELRLRPQFLADLMITPLGAPEFVEALWEQHRRRIVTRGVMWSLAMLLLLPFIGSANWGSLWLFVLSSVYLCAMRGLMALLPSDAACASVCHLLRHMRSETTGAPLETLSGNGEAMGEQIWFTGCASFILGPTLIGFILIFLINIFPSVRLGFQRSELTSITLFSGFFMSGLYQGFMLFSAYRQYLIENRMSAHFHMDVILEVMREQGWNAKR